MKKMIVLLVLALAILFLGAPYYTGSVAKTETLKLVDKMNQSSAEYGTTEVLSYDRNWRNTSARYKYSPPAVFSAFTKEFGEIIYACDSDHGITGIDFTCSLEGDSVYSTFVADKLGGQDPLSVFGSISVFGDIIQTISLDAITGLDIDGTTLNFPKALMTVKTDANASEFEVNGHSEAFKMEGNGEKLAVGAMVVKSNLTQIEGSLFTGDMSIKLDSLDMGNILGETSIKGFSVNSDTSEQGSTLSSKLVFAADKFVSPNSPFETVDDLSFGLDFIGLDKQALIEYQELAQTMQRDTLSALENRAEAPTNSDQIAMLTPVLEKMLKQGLTINSRGHANLNGEANTMELNISLLESLTLEQMSLFLINPDEALKKIDISLNVSLAKSVVDAQPLGAMFIAHSPLVVTSNTAYSLDLKLGDQIQLNDKPMSFFELQTLAFSSLVPK